jgi:hypothetical protein
MLCRFTLPQVRPQLRCLAGRHRGRSGYRDLLRSNQCAFGHLLGKRHIAVSRQDAVGEYVIGTKSVSRRD